jgi:hypothetical protein
MEEKWPVTIIDKIVGSGSDPYNHASLAPPRTEGGAGNISSDRASCLRSSGKSCMPTKECGVGMLPHLAIAGLPPATTIRLRDTKSIGFGWANALSHGAENSSVVLLIRELAVRHAVRSYGLCKGQDREWHHLSRQLASDRVQAMRSLLPHCWLSAGYENWLTVSYASEWLEHVLGAQAPIAPPRLMA